MSLRNHHTHRQIHKKLQGSKYDRFMYFVAFVYPMTGLPQVLQIFSQQDSEGVSLASWVGFIVFELVYLVYGLKHKLAPIVITQLLWLCISSAVVVGIFMYS